MSNMVMPPSDFEKRVIMFCSWLMTEVTEESPARSPPSSLEAPLV